MMIKSAESFQLVSVKKSGKRYLLRFHSGGRRALEELLGIAAGSVVLPCRSGIQGHEASEMAESDFPECGPPLGEHDAEYLR